MCQHSRCFNTAYTALPTVLMAEHPTECSACGLGSCTTTVQVYSEHNQQQDANSESICVCSSTFLHLCVLNSLFIHNLGGVGVGNNRKNSPRHSQSIYVFVSKCQMEMKRCLKWQDRCIYSALTASGNKTGYYQPLKGLTVVLSNHQYSSHPHQLRFFFLNRGYQRLYSTGL